MRNRDFLKQVDERLGENKKLAGGGLPSVLAPVVELVGMKTWQVLLFGSFGVTALWFVMDPFSLLAFVRSVLIMKN